MTGNSKRGRRGRRDSDGIDAHIGRRLRERRRALGLSQAELAARLAFTAAQVNRYEHGTTRLSAAGLWRAAETLGVAPSYFFDGLAGQGGPDAAAPDLEIEARALVLARHLRRLGADVQEKLIGFIASLTRD
ncbi:MAG TPA: helix-turn-helix transcriptional regulator [Candidatus Sulfotelmatobacter sp.]|nr:helix-turn-helix transcriptional regulator [Candidatus Sulfotelmatobacter sp.]